MSDHFSRCVMRRSSSSLQRTRVNTVFGPTLFCPPPAFLVRGRMVDLCPSQHLLKFCNVLTYYLFGSEVWSRIDEVSPADRPSSFSSIFFFFRLFRVCLASETSRLPVGVLFPCWFYCFVIFLVGGRHKDTSLARPPSVIVKIQVIVSSVTPVSRNSVADLALPLSFLHV